MTVLTSAKRHAEVSLVRLQWRGSHDALIWSRWFDLASPDQKVAGYDDLGDYEFCQVRTLRDGVEDRSPIETWGAE